MQYSDNIEQADKKMALVVKLLRQWHLPANPINYAVAYDYVSGNNQDLTNAIMEQLSLGQGLDSFFVDEMFRQYLLTPNEIRRSLVDDMDTVLIKLEQGCRHSNRSSQQFVTDINQAVENIEQLPVGQVKQAVKKIQQASLAYQQQQQRLIQHVSASQQLTNKLQKEVKAYQNQQYLDPLTGLYNRKALADHIEAWYQQDANKSIAAIVVNIDDFRAFSQQFGKQLSNVVLAKIAERVNNYVAKSGLPVRSGNQEFLIMLPDMSVNVASEIADKMRQGVEKLRFVTAKTGMKIPPVKLSVGVTQYQQQHGLNFLMQQCQQLLKQAKQSDNQQVIAFA